MNQLEQTLVHVGNRELEIVCNAAELTEEEYALIRKNSLGASDSSVICGVNLYRKLPQLIAEKNAKYLTDEEKEVGKKPAVIKGRELEDLILHKFVNATGIDTVKPVYMYRDPEFKYLTTNFDGLTVDGGIPVECKYVTRFGERYYNKTVCMSKDTTINRMGDLVDHIKYWADKCGIPAYYYTQVQQQMYFAGSNYGYLAALFEETWQFKVFIIPRDEITITNIISGGAKAADKIEGCPKAE